MSDQGKEPEVDETTSTDADETTSTEAGAAAAQPGAPVGEPEAADAREAAAGAPSDDDAPAPAADDDDAGDDAAQAPAPAAEPEAGPVPTADAAATGTPAVAEADAEPTRRKRRAKAKDAQAEPTAAEGTGVAKEAAQTAARADDAAEHAGRRQPAARTQRAGRRDTATGLVVRAQAKYVRTSARKARLVCDHIRGKSVTEARAILAHTPRAVARDWAKLLESAVANAEHNHELVGDELRILAVTADEGPTIKRFRPRAQGRASRINKRTSHLTIQLTSKEAR